MRVAKLQSRKAEKGSTRCATSQPCPIRCAPHELPIVRFVKEQLQRDHGEAA
jgi:hypothetical protein